MSPVPSVPAVAASSLIRLKEGKVRDSDGGARDEDDIRR